MVSPVGGNACGNVYRSPGSMESSGVYLRFLYTSACSMRSEQREMEARLAPRITISLVLLILDGMSGTIGVLGGRLTSYLGGLERAGGVEVLHCA